MELPHFPADVLGQICAFLSTKAKYELWNSGDKAFRHKMSARRVIESASVRQKDKDFAPPNFASFLLSWQHLKELRVREKRCAPAVTGDLISHLPPNLTKLTLERELGINGETDLSAPISSIGDRFKQLQVLRLLNTELSHESLSLLPPTLTEFSLQTPSEIRDPSLLQLLPPSLTKLILRCKIQSYHSKESPGQELDWAAHWPNLAYLELSGHWTPLIASLPPKLTKLSIEIRNWEDLLLLLPLMPTELEYLKITRFWILIITSQVAASLPRSLTHLHLPKSARIEEAAYQELPARLQILLPSTASEAPLYLPLLRRISCRTIDMPIALHATEVNIALAAEAHFFAKQISFPSTLTRLTIERIEGQIAEHLVTALPKGLLALDTPSEGLNGHGHSLPTSLTSLRINGAFLKELAASMQLLTKLTFFAHIALTGRDGADPSFSSFFGSQLRSLTIYVAGTVTKATLMALPKSLTSLSIHSAFSPWSPGKSDFLDSDLALLPPFLSFAGFPTLLAHCKPFVRVREHHQWLQVIREYHINLSKPTSIYDISGAADNTNTKFDDFDARQRYKEPAHRET